MRTARRLAANTPIQRWPVTTAVYRRVFAFGYGTGDIQATFRGLDLLLPGDDATIVPGIVGGFYEALVLDAFELLAASARHVVDVGANLGLYTVLAGARVPAGARVTAYEPVQDNLVRLRHNLERNQAQMTADLTVDVVESAVGAEAGLVTMHLAQRSVGTHSISAENAGTSRGGGATQEVAVVTLDSDLAVRAPDQPVDLLKVDVEGYDGFVLQGAARVLAEHQPALFVEYVPGHLRNCAFDPQTFLDLVFHPAATVFLVDDVQGRIRAVERTEVPQTGDRNINLIAASRKEHVDALKAWAQTHA